MLRIGGEKAQPRELVDGSTETGEAPGLQYSCEGRPLHPLGRALRMGHLLVRLWFVSLLVRNIPSLRITRNRLSATTCIAAPSQTMPQFDRPLCRISDGACITNELQLGFRVLIRMICVGVWTGSRGTPRFHPNAASRSRCTTGFCCTFSAGTANAVFLGILLSAIADTPCLVLYSLLMRDNGLLSRKVVVVP